MKLARCTPIAWLLVAVLVTGSGDAQSPDDKAALIEHANEPWTGDLDGMVERGFIRVLTTYSPLLFSYDDIGQRGLAVDVARLFEERLNKSHGKKGRPVDVVLIPVARDKLFTGLREGRGDIAAANLTITPVRQALVDFSNPTYPDVSELVVTGPGAPEITSLDDLHSTGVRVRRSSSYAEHLSALNDVRKKVGKPEIPIHYADEHLEDYDLLEMVNAGIVPAIIVDSHKAALWAQVFDDIKVHQGLAVHSGGNIAWAVRKRNPKLLAAINGFVKEHRKGTLLGNILFERYLGSTKWIDNVLSGKARERYRETVDVIKRYAGEYDFDWIKIAAQGYQESKLDQSKRSRAGAVGIMQVLPSTAADPNVGIPDIDKAEQNVHAGVKYLRFLRNRYFSAVDIKPLDRVLFSFAAYNAGPRKISRARKKAAAMGFDPNQWFGHVEVAAAKTISREPVVYVRNIYKYYVAYRRLDEIQQAREAAKEIHPK
jgi:membrane-bound lytic murein transglycosylase MltF